MAGLSSNNPFFRAATNRDENQNQLLVGMMQQQQQQHSSSTTTSSTAPPAPPPAPKKKRNQPGTPYPDAEVIALSPKTLMATNRFICEVCNKGFQREQNLQLHRRGHNLPWKLKQKTTKEVKRKVYLCPEPTCVHHDSSRALGDLTGIKKHYSRKHGEKKWKCEKCSKRYAVQSDWKAHSKTCGTREYRCDCGTLFSRRDSFITHRAFCDALAQESARLPTNLSSIGSHLFGGGNHPMGLSLPHQDNHPNMLRLGGAAAGSGKFDHLLSNPNNPSINNPSLPMMPSSSSFFNMPADSSHDQHEASLFPNKPLHGLIQLPNLQSTSNANVNASSSTTNLFNLGFFGSNNGNSGAPNNSISTTSTNLVISGFNNNVGGGQGTILFSNNMQVGGQDHLFSSSNTNSIQESMVSPHMSATALLQKAAQMGSTSSSLNSNPNLLMRGLASSSSSTGNNANKLDHRPQLLSNYGSTSFNGGDQSLENEQQQLQGFINSLAANGGSDKLTLDFLGVGHGMRDHHHHLQQHHKHGMNMSGRSLDHQGMNNLESQANQQQFGSNAQLQ